MNSDYIDKLTSYEKIKLVEQIKDRLMVLEAGIPLAQVINNFSYEETLTIEKRHLEDLLKELTK